MTGLAGEVIYEAVKFYYYAVIAGRRCRLSEESSVHVQRRKKRGKKQGNLGG